jgi:hypothetical protein
MATRFLLRLARVIDARPGKIAVVCLLAAAVSGAAVSRIPVRTDLLDVLPEGNRTIRAFRGFLEDFGMMDSLVLVISSRERSQDLLIQAVETICDPGGGSSGNISRRTSIREGWAVFRSACPRKGSGARSAGTGKHCSRRWLPRSRRSGFPGIR